MQGARILAIVVTLAGVAIGLTIGSSESLGLAPRTVAVLGIVSGTLTALLSFLPKVQGGNGETP